jgi:hypothetical protein
MAKLIKRKQIDLKLQAVADGVFGDINIPNVLKGDDLESALDKIIKVLDRMSPAMPPVFNTLNDFNQATSITKTGSVSAKELLNGNTVSRIFKQGSGNITWTTSGGTQPALLRDGHFRDGSIPGKLKLTHVIEAVVEDVAKNIPASSKVEKSVILSNLNTLILSGGSANNTATIDGYTVTLTQRPDYYADDTNKATKSGFYTSLKAAITAVMDAPSTALRTIKLEYSEDNFLTSFALTGDYRVESSTGSSVTDIAATAPAMSNYVSGVPTLIENEVITVTGKIVNAVKNYYPTTKIAESTVDATKASATMLLSGGQKRNDTINYSKTHQVNSGQFDESIDVNLKSWDIFAVGGDQSVILSERRIDTIGFAKAGIDAATRFVTNVSAYNVAPATTLYNSVAHSSSLLTGIYATQLQLENGKYIYPSKNYSSTGLNLGGPDYSGATGTRWAEFKIGNIPSGIPRSGFVIFVDGAQNITSFVNTTGMQLYVKVGTGGWLNANASWTASVGGGTGTPGENEGCVTGGVIDATTLQNTSRTITLGGASFGDVTVRISFPAGSNKSFTGFRLG